MTEQKQGVLTEEQAMQLLAFLTSSAEITLREPIHYGTLRLIDAASRLIGFMLENQPEYAEAFLRDFRDEIDLKKKWCMWDKPAYYGFLREAPSRVAGEIQRLKDEDGIDVTAEG
jgi:Family of unknown function (DUF6092)